jgi:hypothetical protein
VPVSHPRDYSGHLQNDFVPGKPGNPLVQILDGFFKPPARDGVKQIFVTFWHFLRHIPQVLLPFFGCAFIERGACLSARRRETEGRETTKQQR